MWSCNKTIENRKSAGRLIACHVRAPVPQRGLPRRRGPPGATQSRRRLFLFLTFDNVRWCCSSVLLLYVWACAAHSAGPNSIKRLFEHQTSPRALAEAPDDIGGSSLPYYGQAASEVLGDVAMEFMADVQRAQAERFKILEGLPVRSVLATQLVKAGSKFGLHSLPC